jgi:hypothetical protein
MRAVTIVTCLMVLGGCTGRTMSSGGIAAVAPQLSVERFLQAVNGRDLVSMSRIFGTSGGPIGDTGSSFGCFWKKIGSAFGGNSCVKWTEVELRMDAIAQILRHQDYQLTSESLVAGRERETRRIGVNLDLPDGRRANDVGFTVVVSGSGQWLIEQIQLERVTGTF